MHAALAELAVRLQEKLTLDQMLALIVECGSRAIGCPHTSLRLLDATRTRLLVTARAGRSIHSRGDIEFRIGEGLVGWVAAEAEVLRVGEATQDPRFVLRPDMAVQIRSFLGVPLIVGGVCIGVLSAASPEPDAFTAAHAETLTLIAAICTPRLEVARLERLASVDPLTGALNRRGLSDALAGLELAPPLAAAMVDVDRFKEVNDRFGHGVGDEVLRHVANVIASSIRSTDAIVRWGGEEFALVLPAVGAGAAAHIAERTRATLEASRAPTSAGDVAVTVSIGVAALRPGDAWPLPLERADRALYRAKSSGRNRVVVADDADD